MGKTEVLREDHRAIRAALSEAGDAFAVGIRQVAVMRERYRELQQAMVRHLKAEEDALVPWWSGLSSCEQSDVMVTHHRQEDQLQAVQAKLESLNQDAEAAWSKLIGLIEGVRQDMRSEESALFPAVDRLDETPARLGDASKPMPRPEVRRALAEDRHPRRGQRAWWVSTLLVAGVIITGIILVPLGGNREEAAPAWKSFSANAIGPVPAGHQVAMVAGLTVEYRGRLMPMSRWAHGTLSFITAATPKEREEAMWVILAIMADPAQWEGRELVWVPPGLRGTLGMAPGATHRSYRQLAAGNSFAQATPEQLERLLALGGLTPTEHEWILIHQRFLSLQCLLEQEMRVVPFPDGRVGRRLPVLRPEGYPFETQIVIKRAWSALLDAVRVGEPARTLEAAQRLSRILRNCQAPRV